MPSDYRVKVGTNVALASLTVMNPQPTSPGLKFTRQVHLGNGHVINQGAYVEWIYNVVEDAFQYIAILTPFGLNVSAAESRAVTIYTRDDMYSYRRYNGVAHRPAATWENYYARNVTILITHLEVLP